MLNTNAELRNAEQLVLAQAALSFSIDAGLKTEHKIALIVH